MSLVLRHALILVVAQGGQATVTGTVRDAATGEPLAGVSVSLPDAYRMTATNGEGRYAFTAVPAGPQHLTIESVGYAGRTLHALVPREGELEVNVSLEPRPVLLPGVDVRRRVAIRGAEEGPPGERGISAAAIAQHPMLSEPDAFLALGGGVALAMPETAEGLHIRGGGGDQTAWLLDGIPVFNPYHSAGVFSAWNTDALSRLDLLAVSPPASLPDVLSGTVAAVTRPPGGRTGGRARLSTTQASLTLDGPIGRAGAGWLVSVRAGLPDVLAPAERSYLGGSTSDWLAKAQTPLLGGTAVLLGYGNDNAFDAAAVAGGDPDSAGGARNRFDWRSRSFGATWTRALGSTTVRLRTWSASTEAGSTWRLGSSSANLRSERRDAGFAAGIERHGPGVTSAGVRVERSRTRYRVGRGATGGEVEPPSPDLRSTTPVASLFVEHERQVGRHFAVDAGAAITASTGGLYPTPRLKLSWLPGAGLTVAASLARSHQFAQSLRNAESIVGSVFPADLFIGTNADGVPVGRSDTGVLSAELRPTPGWRVGAQAYARVFEGLLLMAPADGEPFATAGFAAGSGTARGASLEASFSGARFGATAGWGWRRVRRSRAGAEYTPEHGAAHDIEAGIVVFPGPTSAVRLGVTGLFGRRTTAIPGTFEWESCNLLDQGCEFGGSPHYGEAAPGSARLPGYVRVDAGLRRHWDLRAFGRNTTFAVYGTLTNAFGRANLLTWAADPLTGRLAGIEMRPRAPLVLGIDVAF